MTSTPRQVQAKLAATRTKHLQALTRGLWKAGLTLQRDSQKLVPVQLGVLKASARTDIDSTKPEAPIAVISYNTDYAVHVHERQDVAHGAKFNTKHAVKIAKFGPNHAVWFKRGANQQAKFLEKPARANARKYKDIIANEVKRA